MQQTSYTASNYRQIVCDLKNNILDEVRVIINNRFEDVIKKTDNDNSAEELNIINTLIRQIPIFKKLEEDYKNLIEENIVLKDKLNYFFYFLFFNRFINWLSGRIKLNTSRGNCLWHCNELRVWVIYCFSYSHSIYTKHSN